MEHDPLQHRLTLVFDRETYSPEFFRQMKDQRIAVLTYHRHRQGRVIGLVIGAQDRDLLAVGGQLANLPHPEVARWTQENFYQYMREHYSLDRLVEYGIEPLPEDTRVVNPAWRQLDRQIRRKNGQLQQQHALFGHLGLQAPLSESEVTRFERNKGQMQEGIDGLNKAIAALKKQRQETPHHLAVKDLPEQDRFSRLAT